MDKVFNTGEDRIFWVQRSGSTRYNDGEYKLKLLNGEVVGVGDEVLVKFSNGNFRGRIKQTAGFGIGSTFDVVSVLFPGKTKGKKVPIDNVLSRV